MTQVPNRMDSPRAEGRLGIAWANMLLLLDQPADRANLLAHVGARTQAIENAWLGRNFVNDSQKPIRILATGSDPTFLEPNSTRVPAIIVWEHSIATMGFYGLWRVTGDQRLHDLAAEISKVIVNHCIYQEGGHWITCTADALPAGRAGGRRAAEHQLLQRQPRHPRRRQLLDLGAAVGAGLPRSAPRRRGAGGALQRDPAGHGAERA